MSNVKKGGRSIVVSAKYAGKWVAWSGDRTHIVASGDTIREARQKAQKKGEENPWLDKIPDFNVRFGGAAFLG